MVGVPVVVRVPQFEKPCITVFAAVINISSSFHKKGKTEQL
jgi:hypothetical protein